MSIRKGPSLQSFPSTCSLFSCIFDGRLSASSEHQLPPQPCLHHAAHAQVDQEGEPQGVVAPAVGSEPVDEEETGRRHEDGLQHPAGRGGADEESVEQEGGEADEMDV